LVAKWLAKTTKEPVTTQAPPNNTPNNMCKQTMAQIAEKDTIGAFVNGKNAANVQTALKGLYNKKALLWQDAKTRDAKPAIEQYLKQLRTAAANGLNPADYGLANIEKQYAALYPLKQPRTIQPP
jgi:hypothetical protein